MIPLVIKALETINNTFNQYGKQVYLVGGCLRDIILQRGVKDYDLATNMNPHEMLIMCQNEHLAAYESGINYGTITIVINDIPFEITTFRKDSNTSDARCFPNASAIWLRHELWTHINATFVLSFCIVLSSFISMSIPPLPSISKFPKEKSL
jgi:tRNA nucleotidyltransferase/poly(A) polymerase